MRVKPVGSPPCTRPTRTRQDAVPSAWAWRLCEANEGDWWRGPHCPPVIPSDRTSTPVPSPSVDLKGGGTGTPWLCAVQLASFRGDNNSVEMTRKQDPPYNQSIMRIIAQLDMDAFFA